MNDDNEERKRDLKRRRPAENSLTVNQMDNNNLAIVWDHSPTSNKCCYWTDDILNLFRPLTPLSSSSSSSSCDESSCRLSSSTQISSVSFETLFDLAAAAAIEFLDKYLTSNTSLQQLEVSHQSTTFDDTADGTSDRRAVGVPIAVAIPEGPLLPLAVLVVHVLNAVHKKKNFYTVLVPIEPSEGFQRNCHILDDVRPLIVLAVPNNQDWDRLQEILQQQQQQQEKQQQQQQSQLQENDRASPSHVSSNGLLVNSCPPEIVDFFILVENARKRWLFEKIATQFSLEDMQMPTTIEEQLISMTGISMEAVIHRSDSRITGRQSNTNIQRLVISIMDKIRNQHEILSYQKNEDEAKEDDNGATPHRPMISHIVFTSGTTGRPKGCISSTPSLCHYIYAKNHAHGIINSRPEGSARVLLASSLSFDPCLSDILATIEAGATLCIVPRNSLMSNLSSVLSSLQVTHVLCTPSLWSLVSTDYHHVDTASIDGNAGLNDRYPFLRCVALGGEPIPRRILNVWARSAMECSPANHSSSGNDGAVGPACSSSVSKTRLIATYGVTEACVYQTFGEVFRGGAETTKKGQNTGHPLQGMHIRICREDIQDSLVDVPRGAIGEVVLYGAQLDEQTRYLNRIELEYKFVAERQSNSDEGEVNYHYRTGDRGFVDSDGLYVLGRIVGEEGMIKINGVRVELTEVEAAVIDQNSFSTPPVIVDCLCKFIKDEDKSAIYAYVVIDKECRKEIGMSEGEGEIFGATVVNDGPLWTLLHARCAVRLKASCIPSVFVAIPSIPLSPTGKRNRDGLPDLGECRLLNETGEETILLKHYGSSGAIVSDTLAEYLNLHECQLRMLSTDVTFAMLGGDSLSATIVCRTLHAKHRKIINNRFVGGASGQFPEPFNVSNLLRAKNLGQYVDLLDQHGVSRNGPVPTQHDSLPGSISGETDQGFTDARRTTAETPLYDALLQAVTLGQSIIAISLLHEGADPNSRSHGGRIGKTSGRVSQRAIFKSSPLHLACNKADVRLINELVKHGAKVNTPNTNGLFGIHLVAAGLNGDISTYEEATIRCQCAKILLEAGCPLLMRDANRQSVLHCAARAGHSELVEFFVNECKSQKEAGKICMSSEEFINWNSDHWYRAPIHWAVLNGRVETLKVLLKLGADPSPRQPTMKRKSSLRSSVKLETPLEICDRLHGNTAIGLQMKRCLLNAIDREREKQGNFIK